MPLIKRAINFHQRGELRDRTGEGQHYRVAGLNLLAAIIIYWNTLKLGDAVFARRQAGLEDFAPSRKRPVVAGGTLSPTEASPWRPRTSAVRRPLVVVARCWADSPSDPRPVTIGASDSTPLSRVPAVFGSGRRPRARPPRAAAVLAVLAPGSQLPDQLGQA